MKRKEVAAIVLMTASAAMLGARPSLAVDDLSLNVESGSECVEATDTVTVTLDVANLSAAINGVQVRLHYDNTLLTLVDIVPIDLGFSEPDEGWVEIASDAPIVGLELIHANDAAQGAWGLAGAASQPRGTTVYLPHYDTTQRWWTLFALANPDDLTQATPLVRAYGNDGTLAGSAWQLVDANGRIADRVEDLFGLLKDARTTRLPAPVTLHEDDAPLLGFGLER